MALIANLIAFLQVYAMEARCGHWDRGETQPMGHSTFQRIYRAPMQSYSTMSMATWKTRLTMAVDTVSQRLSDFEGQGSGWRLSCIDRVAIHCSKHSPITVFSYIPSPKSIESRLCNCDCPIIQMMISDFSTPSLLTSIRSDPHPNRSVTTIRPSCTNLTIQASHTLWNCGKSEKIEDKNPNISVNVLYQDQETYTIMPLRVTQHRNRQHHVNHFLLYDDGVKEDGTEKPPDRLNESNIGWRTQKPSLSQSIIILWFENSPHCSGKIQLG